MARWDEFIASTSYEFKLVDRATGREKGVVRALKGGTITRNDDTRIKESAEFGVVGPVSFGSDLVRVYMRASWADGGSEDVVLGTFLPVVPGRKVRQGYSTASVRMYGRLQELLDDRFAVPYTVEKGRNAVDCAREVCEAAGLTVVADPSSYCVSETRYYGGGAAQNNSEVGDTKLDMVNDLLSLAGFRAAWTDPWGRVVFERYRDPSEIASSWTFEEGASAKFEADMDEERDYTDAANHVVVVYGTSNASETVAAEAWDRDPASDLSTVSRGRTITRLYSYSDLPPGKTREERLGYARHRAASLLSTSQSVIWRVSIRHAYAPIKVNDMASLSYRSGGIEGRFQVRKQTLALSGGCPTDTELRVFRRRS